MAELPQGQVQAVRSVVKAETEPIVIEVFKDKDGKIVRQQSFTKDSLIATKANLKKQYDEGVKRLDEMVALLA